MKNLWANGDSHTAGTHSRPFANIFAKQLADRFNLTYTNIATAGGSNQRIIRTTIENLPTLDPKDTFLLIGWSSFDRTEWFWNNSWHTICGDPGYYIPDFAKQNWPNFKDPTNNKQWVIAKEQEHLIWVFHKLLHNLGYKFLFFLTCADNHFKYDLIDDKTTKLPWLPDTWAHDPYDKNAGFTNFCIEKGHKSDRWWHFDHLAHTDYAEFLTPMLRSKLL
jgi:hypothetical protein